MRFQSTNFSCGPASLGNALRALGVTKVPTEAQLIRITECSRHGVDDWGVASGAVLLGRRVAPVKGQADVYAFVRKGYPVLLSAYQDTHWVTIVGLLGEKWVVVDSDYSLPNRKENGCYVVHPWQLKSNFQGVVVLDARGR